MEMLESQTCAFLRLPLEIRNEIYRYLLCTQYNKRLSEAPRPTIYMLWPNYIYGFHTAILRTNRQIQLEALYLARHENMFIRICCRDPDQMEKICYMAGITPVDLELGHCVMQVDLEWLSTNDGESHVVGSNGPTTDCLICLDQLTALCEGLAIWYDKSHNLIGGTITFNLYIFGHSRDEEFIEETLPVSTQRQLLEPFTLLSSARDCQIHGPIDSEYKASILLQVSCQDRTLECVLQKIYSLVAEGKQAFLDSRFSSAIDIYGSALKEVAIRPDVPTRLIYEGEHAGQTCATMANYLIRKFCSNLAAAYLKLHQWQKAFDWAYYGVDCVGYRDYNPRDYAVLLFRLALACKELGECERASERYRAANKFVHGYCRDIHDGELDALMLPLSNPHDGYLEAALQETTV